MNDNRRTFLKMFAALAAGLGFHNKLVARSTESPIEKVKMLTPDGRLVEVMKKNVKQQPSAPASNGDVLEWMETQNKTS